MWKINYEDALNRMYPDKDGYELIKVTKLNIPLVEIGLNVLVRKEINVPFLQEIILKLIENKSNTTEQLERILGLESDIINDVVGQMYYNNLLEVTEHRITLNSLGCETLKTLKKITKEKDVINKLYINGITGKIIDLEHSPYTKEKKSSRLYLDPIIEVDDNYFINNFKKICDVYLNRMTTYARYRLEDIPNEIIQIIDKKYENIVYIEDILLIYKNKFNDDMIFECKGNDNIYGTTFSSQIKSNVGLSDVFDNIRINNKTFTLESKKTDNKNILKELIKEHKKDDEIDEYYFKDRYLFELEYLDIVDNIKKIKPQNVLVSCGYMFKKMNNSVTTALLSNLNNIDLTFVYKKEDPTFLRFKNEIMEKGNKNRDKIRWIEYNLDEEINIIMYPECMIKIKLIPHSYSNNKKILQEISEIIFNKKDIILKLNEFGIEIEEKELKKTRSFSKSRINNGVVRK